MNIHHPRLKDSQDGFTIVELMIATLVFSVILVVITSGVIHFTSGYYKGLNSSAVQTAARNIMTTIAQDAQFGGGSSVSNFTLTSDSGVICATGVQLFYYVGAQVPANNAIGKYGVIKTTDHGTDCGQSGVDPIGDSTAQQLLNPQMRLTDVSITNPDSSGLVNVAVGIAYGDDDLLCVASQNGGTGGCGAGDPLINTATFVADGSEVTCKSQIGQQFCAVSHLSTTVQQRVTGK